MPEPQVTRRVYSAEQLHELRSCCSAPKLSEAIEEHVVDDAELVKVPYVFTHSNKPILFQPYTTTTSHGKFRYCMMDQDADLEFHRGWVEQIFATPSPLPRMVRYAGNLSFRDNSPAEHVLRGSRSFAARSFRSRNGLGSLRVPSDRTNNENASVNSSEHLAQPPNLSSRQVLGEIVNTTQLVRAVPGRLRPSPTPSLKRKKAEAIVKAHGSPTHVRVTAGGRIVPSEQSPLCLPRYGYSAVKVNGGLVKFAPNHQMGKALQWSQTAQDGSQNGFVAQDIEGRLCQIVNGTILPLTEVDGGLRLYMPAPNLNITERGFSNGNMAPFPSVDQDQQPIVPPQPSVEAQIRALEIDYAKFEHELKDVDKTEVIHGKSMGKTAKDALVAKRRELVITMDRIRKAIKGLKNVDQGKQRPQTPKVAGQSGSSMSPVAAAGQPMVQHSRPAMQTGPFAQLPGPLYGNPGFMAPHSPFGHGSMPSNESRYMAPPFMMPPVGLFMHPPPFDGPSGWYPPYSPYADFGNDSFHAAQRPVDTAVSQTDGTASIHELRPQSPRSHALALKDPDTKQIINVKSLLNPMSPVYKPSVDGAKSERTSELEHKTLKDRPPTPLSFTHLPMTHDQSGRQHEGHHTTNTSSGSSIRTTDFFPHNAREHSMRKHEYPRSVGSSEDKENTIPSTSVRNSSEFSTIQQKPSRHDADWNPDIPARTFKESTDNAAPRVPPGTPIDGKLAQQPGFDDIIGHRHSHFLPRGQGYSQHNKSGSHIQHSNDGASSDIAQSGTFMIDFSNKPVAWIEGYQAGLHRRPVNGNSIGDFLDGYCSGLLKSQPTGTYDARPKMAPNTISMGHRQLAANTLELATKSMDCLKEAVIAPSNEAAVLTPALDGPSIDDTNFNHSGWQKQHDFFMSAGGQGLSDFPYHRNSSVAQVPHKLDLSDTQDKPDATKKRQSNASSAHLKDVLARLSVVTLDEAKLRSKLSEAIPSTVSTNNAASEKDRPAMLNQGKRIISPLEWRTRNSLANIANMTSSIFAHTQYDGGPGDKLSSYSDRDPMLSNAADMSGSPLATEHDSRFKEASLDGLSPAGSPEPLSPPVSPRTSPAKMLKDRRASAKDSPIRPSPTKTRFDQIVSKVGIKTSPVKISPSGEHGSPQGKRHWNLWKGSRNVSGKHEAL